MLRTDPTLNFLIRERRLCQNLTYLLSPKLIFQESDVIVKEEYKFCFTTCWILVGIYIIETWIWSLTPTLAAWPLRGHTALKSIFWETLFLNQLHDFCLYLKFIFTPIFEIKIHEKNSLTPKNYFRRLIFINKYIFEWK